jgi:AbrB family looped-hinge helix DNA binding protein
MLATVGQKGQIVIEKALRDALGLRPGYFAVQKLVNDHIEIYFYPPEHKRSLRGRLANKIQKRIATEDWQAVREAAWSNAAAEQTQAQDSPT